MNSYAPDLLPDGFAVFLPRTLLFAPSGIASRSASPAPIPGLLSSFPRRIPGQAEPFRTLRHRQNVAITLRIKPYRRLYLLPRERQTAPFGVSDKVICDPNLQRFWRAEAESLRPESLKKRPGLPLMLLFSSCVAISPPGKKIFSQSARSVGNGERGRNLCAAVRRWASGSASGS